MRITIEPTTGRSAIAFDAAAVNHRVVIEHPYDDLDAYLALELAGMALKAYGYPAETIDGILNESDD